MELALSILQDGVWTDLGRAENGVYPVSGGTVKLELTPHGDETGYVLSADTDVPVRVRLKVCGQGFAVIPGCMFGDNGASRVKRGEYPLLTDRWHERFCAPLWEFRADRAAMPAAVQIRDGEVWGISVDPYTQRGARNGIWAALDGVGISLGYTDDPCQFIDKTVNGQMLGDSVCEDSVRGRIYCLKGKDARAAEIIRREYLGRRALPEYRKSIREAADALFDAFVDLNWDGEEYTNRCCRLPDWTSLRPWRQVTEIGWTGGAVLALPMLMYEEITGRHDYHGARTAREQFDRICACYHEASGMLYDLMVPSADGSRVNGWWTGYGLVRDCHCAYLSGTAVYSLLYAADFLKKRGKEVPESWMETARRVLETAVELQREDGAMGYTFAVDRKAVLDYDGFAGCWFVTSLVLYYGLTGETRWREAAVRGLGYYAEKVRTCQAYGSPMDTWKAVDQEGNLAFVRAASLLWDLEKSPEALAYLETGAEYEYFWRFGYRTRPECVPIREGWSACGGSITSVSNPHIHPMGVLINRDLEKLGAVTGNAYHAMRAEDGLAWLMQTLELYPEKTGYGRYGVLSERWCPSDGLVTERFSDGRPYSSWFSYNLWAAADALMCLCEYLEK